MADHSDLSKCGQNDVNIFSTIARKGLSSMFDCFLTVKAYQGRSITIFVLRFLLIQSYTYETIWCLLRHQTTFIISSKLQI